MPLTPGTRLGAYEIVSAIGAGGMGEVYKAHDTRLDRDVAIKVLPPHLADDEVARSRFEREAKAIAALSHPNILAIYDVGTEGKTAFVVMELLEGETLRQRLGSTSLTTGGAGASSAALPIRKVTQIGIEIALGLAAAHDKQIVHRDIKPENVFIASDGRVKLLDFGLARAIDPGGTGSSARPAAGAGAFTDTPTQLQHTDPGMIMGTIGYMAPEQVKAQPVDHRADIFSLGCVLYEMATGRRPFARDNAAETMSAILRDEPDDLTRDSGAIPAAFEPIVRHCLEKRPEERFQSARDLAFALQSLGAASSGQTSQTSAGSVAYPGTAGAAGMPDVAALSQLAAAAGAAVRRRIWTGYAIGLGIGIAVGITAFFVVRALGRGNGASDPGGGVTGPAGAYFERFQQITDVAGVETTPTLSPDGKTIVYVSDAAGTFQIYSQRVGSRSAAPLTSGSANMNPAFSPDGERIAFRSERDGGGIFLMSASGESVTRVSDEGFSPSWSPDGTELVAARGTFVSPTDLASTAPGLFAIDIKSGKKRDVMKTGQALQPAWSPHGYRVAYFSLRAKTGQRDLFTVAADGSQADSGPTDVTNDAPLDWSPVWSPTGDYLYFSSNRGGTMNLWRVAIDERSGKVLGDAEPMTTPSNWSGMMSFSRDGSAMAFASLDWRSTLLRQNFDPVREVNVGAPIPLLKGSRPIRDHDLSPDGQWIAFNETAPREDLIVARVDGTEYRRLTDDAARDRGPTWTTDGQRIVFYSDRGGLYDMWSIHPDGSHLEQVTAGGSPNFPVMSPDGKRLAFGGVQALAATIIPVTAGAPTQSGAATEPPMAGGQVFWPFSWSKSGAELIGFGLKPQGTVGALTVYDVATKQYRSVGHNEEVGWVFPVWLKDSRRFLVRTASGIEIGDASTGGARKILTRVRGYYVGKSLSVAADNSWYSYTETGTEGDIWVAVIKAK